MTSKRLSAKAREYMRTHPGVRYQEALRLVENAVHVSSYSTRDARFPNPSSLPWLPLFGLSSAANYDPLVAWATPCAGLRIPLGWELSEEADERTEDADSRYVWREPHTPVTLDLADISRGGTGPHGMLQGVTGSGRTFASTHILFALGVGHSPDGVQFLVADAGWSGCGKAVDLMPHCVGHLHDLQDPDKLHAFGEALRGEVQRRQTLLRSHACSDITEYRETRKSRPEMPVLPELVVLVEDFYEVAALLRLDVSDAIGYVLAVGRCLGMRMLMSAQVVDLGVMGRALNHVSYGISLRTMNRGSSAALLGGDGSAVGLPPGTGYAKLRTSNGESPEPSITTVAIAAPHADGTGSMDTMIAAMQGTGPWHGCGELRAEIARLDEVSD